MRRHSKNAYKELGLFIITLQR